MESLSVQCGKCWAWIGYAEELHNGEIVKCADPRDRSNTRAPLPKIEGLREALENMPNYISGPGLVVMQSARAYLERMGE